MLQTGDLRSRSKGLAIRASVKRKKTLSLDFLKIVSTATKGSSLPAGPNLRFHFIESDRRGPWPIVAIRSVSHLVLARVGLIHSLPPNSNRKERAGTGDIAGSVSAPSGSVFLRQATH